MNGFVSKLYDIDSIEIPEEMLKVCVDEKYGVDAIVRLSLRYADESEVETVSEGDLVYCHADKESYPDGRTILIFTGTPVPGAEKAAMAVLGKSVGDVVSTSICEKKVELKIEKILHRTPAFVDDKLISDIGIDGVDTVESYKKYVINEALENLKTEKVKDINRFVIDKMLSLCEFTYDEAEMAEHSEKMSREMLEEYGDEIDMPFEDLKNEAVLHTKQDWIAKAFCESRGFEADTQEAEEEADQMIEMMELAGEKIPDREELIESSVMGQYYNELFTYIENSTKQKMGG